MTDNKERGAFLQRLADSLPDGVSFGDPLTHEIAEAIHCAALAASQEKAEPVALRKTFEEWLGEVVADGGCTVEALLVGDADPIRCARSAWDACIASLAAAPQPSAEAALGWSGWACQYPGSLPRLYGAREIAEVNLDASGGDRLLYLVEATPQQSATSQPATGKQGEPQ